MKTFGPEQFHHARPPEDLSNPLKALWWLKKGALKPGPEWEEAHGLCQMAEGEPSHDLVHALAHWIEGDLPNADYWYQRAGSTKAGDIESEWKRIEACLFSKQT